MNRSMVISLIGRPNVGKSSLFNRLLKNSKKAITHNRPGVTRDRHYSIATFDELHDADRKSCVMVDTGGFYPKDIETETREDIFFNIMRDQAKLAIEESDLVVVVVDVREGLVPFDQEIVDYIRSCKKNFILAANKYDSDKQEGDEIEFYSTGIEEENFYVVSAAHGLGTQTLRERLQREIVKFEEIADENYLKNLQLGVTPREKVAARVALIGAPNAGKSTLLNKLIGEQRALVSDIPGTTMDPIEGFFDLYFGTTATYIDGEKYSLNQSMLIKNYEQFRSNNPDFVESGLVNEEVNYDDFDKLLDEEEEVVESSHWRSVHIIDTAGIRRKKAIDDVIESQSVFRSLRCINEADIVVYLVDSTIGITHQDRRLLDIAFEKGKSIIIAMNKSDLISDTLRNKKKKEEWMLDQRDDIPWLSFCDVIPISAKEGRGIKHLKKALKKTILIRNIVIPTGLLNRTVSDLITANPIVVKNSGGKRLKLKYASMVKNSPPTFLLFTNRSKGIPENYRRYLKNSLRGQFSLDNTPVHLIFRSGDDSMKATKRSRK